MAIDFYDLPRDVQRAFDEIAEHIGYNNSAGYLMGTGGEHAMQRLLCQGCEERFVTDTRLACCNECWEAV